MNDTLQPRSDVLLTEAQAAHLLSLKPRTLQMWRIRGTGPAFIKVGAAVRYRQHTLSTWLAARTTTTTAHVVGGGRR